MNQEMNCIWAVAAEDWNCFLNSLTMVKLTRDVATRSIVSTAAIVMMQMHPLSYSYFTSTSTIQHRIHPAPWSGIIRTDICKFLFVFKFIGKKYLKICDIIYLWKWRQQVATEARLGCDPLDGRGPAVSRGYTDKLRKLADLKRRNTVRCRRRLHVGNVACSHVAYQCYNE